MTAWPLLISATLAPDRLAIMRCADGADDRGADHDRHAATEDHDLAVVGLLDAVERRARLRHGCEVRGALVEDARRDRLADGKLDTADQGAVLSGKRQQRAAGVDDCDIVGNPQARGPGFAGGQHSLGVR